MKYEYGKVDMMEVINNIEEYIIPENREACKLLWSKNIFTIMCNNYDNNESWITLSKLSDDNQKIFDECSNKDKRFGFTFGGIGLKVPINPLVGIDTYDSFKELIDKFLYQDVQSDGCMSLVEFMTYYTDCYEIRDGSRVFVECKMTKSYEEYIQDSEFSDLYIDGKIYYNKMYYDAHLNFKIKNNN